MSGKKSKKVYKNQLFGVGLKKSRGITTIINVEQKDFEQYKSLLLDGLKMPVKPQLMFYVSHFTKVIPWPLRGYRESSVCIRVKHSSGQEGWQSFTMPVTGRLALWTGLKVGYPKYKPDSLTLKSVGNKWRGNLQYKGKSPFNLEFNPADVEVIHIDGFTQRVPFILPSKEKGKFNLMELAVHKINSLNEISGMVTITIDSDEEWTQLIHAEKIEAPGIFHQFEGKGYLTRKEQKPL